MPYIKFKDRPRLIMEPFKASTAGELNYVIHDMLASYFDRKGFCYTTANEVIGVLECVKLELYRRALGPYEIQKAAENGDIPLYRNK